MEIDYSVFENVWSIERALFDWLLENIPAGSNLIELGSGRATNQLLKVWNVWSIEQNKEWAEKALSEVIYAPIKGNWFDRTCIENRLPVKYAAVLVDAPTQESVGRRGLLDNLDLFDLSVPFLFDDVDRSEDYKVMREFAEIVGRCFTVHKGKKKEFAIV
jgi:hypothetical protein